MNSAESVVAKATPAESATPTTQIGDKLWTYAPPVGVVWGIVSEINGNTVVLQAGSFASSVALETDIRRCARRKADVRKRLPIIQ